jgi:hypothetical protein
MSAREPEPSRQPATPKAAIISAKSSDGAAPSAGAEQAMTDYERTQKFYMKNCARVRPG